jgi:hypothetical protein
VAACAAGRGGATHLVGVYVDEALAPAGPPGALEVLLGRVDGRPRLTLRVSGSGAAGAAGPSALAFLGHVANDGAAPAVTLSALRVRAAHPGGAGATIAGTFRGAAVAGRSSYRLLPVGRAVATYRAGAVEALRALVDEVFIDARSGSGYLRLVGTGTLIGRRAADGCRHIAFRYTAHGPRGAAALRWACRPRPERSPPALLDVFARPRDRIASAYALIRRPCWRLAQAAEAASRPLSGAGAMMRGPGRARPCG